MKARHFILLLFMLGAGSAFGNGKDAPVTVDLRAHRAEIRAALLLCTPFGSSDVKVLRFIAGQLGHAGDAPAATGNEPATGPAADDRKVREAFDQTGRRAAGDQFVNGAGGVAERNRANRAAKPDDARPKKGDLKITRLSAFPQPDPNFEPPNGPEPQLA